jgi:TfoX/Sxy family transcriptional regulator of competence genes
MSYNISLAERIRAFLSTKPDIKVEEKKMFGGLTFMVNGKMCVNVSADNLMCRFDPSFQHKVSGKKGFQVMVMKGREYQGYCYVNEKGYKLKKDFEYWLHLCLEYNDKAKQKRKSNQLSNTTNIN